MIKHNPFYTKLTLPAFGSLKNGRNFSVGSGYRFGFNGKENDGESFEGCVAFEARIFDSRLGRFLSTDPKQNTYPWQTPYAYFANTPIVQVDILGMGGPFQEENGGPNTNSNGTSAGAKTQKKADDRDPRNNLWRSFRFWVKNNFRNACELDQPRQIKINSIFKGQGKVDWGRKCSSVQNSVGSGGGGGGSTPSGSSGITPLAGYSYSSPTYSGASYPPGAVAAGPGFLGLAATLTINLTLPGVPSWLTDGRNDGLALSVSYHNNVLTGVPTPTSTDNVANVYRIEELIAATGVIMNTWWSTPITGDRAWALAGGGPVGAPPPMPVWAAPNILNGAATSAVNTFRITVWTAMPGVVQDSFTLNLTFSSNRTR